MSLSHPVLRRVDVTLEAAAATTGWTNTVRLSALGRSGRILAVKLRQDATDDYGDAAVVRIARATGDLSGSTDALDVAYESASIALAGSATDASLEDALPIPAPYAVDAIGELRIAANVTSGTGTAATKLYVAVHAEVWG